MDPVGHLSQVAMRLALPGFSSNASVNRATCCYSIANIHRVDLHVSCYPSRATTGEIPQELWDLSRLTVLCLQGHSFDGTSWVRPRPRLMTTMLPDLDDSMCSSAIEALIAYFDDVNSIETHSKWLKSPSLAVTVAMEFCQAPPSNETPLFFYHSGTADQDVRDSHPQRKMRQDSCPPCCTRTVIWMGTFHCEPCFVLLAPCSSCRAVYSAS